MTREQDRPTDDAAHRRLQELLGAHVLGRLEADEEVALRAHLDGCATCRAELAELAPLAEALRLVDHERQASPASPPPDLGARIAAQVGHERELRDRRASSRRRARTASWAAAAVLLVGTAFGAGTLVDEDAPPPAVVREPVALRPQQPGIGVSSAVLVPHTWGLEVQLTMTGFAPGEHYRAVALARDGERLPAGEFLGVAGRPVVCNMQAALLRQDAVGFLVLDDGGRTVAAADLPA